MYAKIVGVELIVIDENTTVNALENELRWNDAAYRLETADGARPIPGPAPTRPIEDQRGLGLPCSGRGMQLAHS
jgi:hypothetical protein